MKKTKKLNNSPARLPTPRQAPVHNIISDQEERLQPLDAPAQGVGFKPRVRGQRRDGFGHGRRGRRVSDDRGDSVSDGKAAVELPSGHVEVEHAAGVGGGELGLVAQQGVGDELVAERGVDGEELLRKKRLRKRRKKKKGGNRESDGEQSTTTGEGSNAAIDTFILNNALARGSEMISRIVGDVVGSKRAI